MNHTFCKKNHPKLVWLHHDMIEPCLLSTCAKASASSELVLLPGLPEIRMLFCGHY